MKFNSNAHSTYATPNSTLSSSDISYPIFPHPRFTFWDENQDKLLTELAIKYNRKWKVIAGILGKTPVGCFQRHQILQTSDK